MQAAEDFDIGRSSLDAAYQYAADIRDRKIDACRWVQLAVERWYRDLDNAGERGLYFDENAAARVFRFFAYLKHSKGKWKGQPIILEPWQCFILANVFGWMRSNGRRRFTTVYEEVPRKNGKSTKIGGVGVYGTMADDEGGSEVYSAATKRDQAKIMWSEACRMVKQSPALKRRMKVTRTAIEHESSFSSFEPLGKDSDSADGLNVHFGLVDELHAHKDADMWDVLESAIGAREQALMWAITTAGTNKEGVCYELRDYAMRVLSSQGDEDDDSFFAIIYTIDKEDLDHWDEERIWRKANPNYGVSVNKQYFEDKIAKARMIPSAKNNFLTKNLDVWVSVSAPWIDVEVFKKCHKPVDRRSLKGAKCWGGLDLGAVSDLTSWALVFDIDGRPLVLTKSYLPEACISEHTRKYNQPFKQWAEAGWLEITPGNATDYAFMEHDLSELSKEFDIQEIAFDRWNSSQTVTNLMGDGFDMVPFGQGYGSMSQPMKDVERLVLGTNMIYESPVLSWAVGNTVAVPDPAGNIKPAKNLSKGKIDPVVAMIMAIGRLYSGDARPAFNVNQITFV